MPESHRDHGSHDHPTTFDEVIKRGFPHKNLEGLRIANQDRVRSPSSRPTLLTVTTVATRKNGLTSFSIAEQTAFKSAIVRLVEEGRYLELIRDHMDMSHNMHGSMGEAGLYRFLAWHRRYLLACEREIQRVDALLRPSATENKGSLLAMAEPLRG